MDEQTTTTTKKLSAAAIGGPVGVVIVWTISEFAQVEVPAEVGAAIGAALTFIASILIPDSKEI